jgi:hypothetical protein
MSLSIENVFVTANPQPCSKPLFIIAPDVHGVALAKPYGFKNFNPQNSVEISTLSIGVQNNGNCGFSGTSLLFKTVWIYLWIVQLAVFPSFTLSTVVPFPVKSPPAKTPYNYVYLFTFCICLHF